MRLQLVIQRRLCTTDAGRASGLLAGFMLVAAMMSPAAMAAREDRSGSEIVANVCAACHTKGENGAPRIGDKVAWAQRASAGLTALTTHALQGIRNMPSHGGNPGLSDIEVERAIVHIVNLSGGRWVEPLHGASPAVVLTGEQVVKQHCSQCHGEGLGGAPKIGDRAAWTPRMSAGLDKLVASAVHGHGGMPPRGGVADLSDTGIRAAVIYMFNVGVVSSPSPSPQAARRARAAKADDPYHKVIRGADVYLGIMPAQAVRSGQPKADVPSGKDYYHLNVSLVDAKTRSAIDNARIELRVEDPMSSETRTLEPITANDRTSYGAYFRMPGLNPYTITAQIRRPGFAGVAEAKFEYRPGR